MAIYELTESEIKPITPTSFKRADVRERQDLQRVLRDRIDVVSPDTLVIAEEFCEWEESRRRIDLLGLDKDANLVVIELKRTEDGGHMELQAVRYAAMISARIGANCRLSAMCPAPRSGAFRRRRTSPMSSRSPSIRAGHRRCIPASSKARSLKATTTERAGSSSTVTCCRMTPPITMPTGS